MAVIRQGGGRAAGAIGLVVAVLALAGCWPQAGGTPDNQNANLIEDTLTPDTVADLTQIWTAPGVLDAVVGNQVLGADASGLSHQGFDSFARLRSLDAGTGAEQWSRQLLPPPVTFPPTGFFGAAVGDPATVQGNRVMVGVYGTLVVGGMGPTCTDFTMSATLDDSAAPGFVGTTGMWSPNVPFGGRRATETRGFSAPPGGAQPQQCAFGPGTLEVRQDDATAPTDPIWSAPGGDRPVVTGDQLLVASGSTVRSFVASGCGAATCDPVWSTDLGVPVADMTVGTQGRLYALTAPGPSGRELVVVNLADGSVEWHSTPLPGSETGPASMSVMTGRVFVAAGTTLSAFADGDTGCGDPVCGPGGTATLPGPFAGNLASGGGIVYAGDAGGHVTAWQANSCEFTGNGCLRLKTLTVDGTPTRLVQALGRLFVETDDGAGTTLQVITAFGLPS
jgi:PQQ-like domain